MKISLKIRAIAVVTVALHLFTFSVPKAFADGIAIYDAQGNQVSQSDGTTTTANLIAGNAYHTNNADINIDQALNVTVLNAQGLADATAKAIVEILGDKATSWAGSVNIEGIVAFINEHGFDIAQSFQGNVNGGAILSTLAVNQGDFFSGLAELARGANQNGASINNAGNFNVTKDSFLALVASAIKNQGNISANGGAVAFAVGDKVKLDLSGGNDLISVTVDKPVESQVLDANGNVLKDGISNSGNVKADGGLVILTASAKEHVFDNLINHSGVIEANTISNKGGQIILDGGDQGIVSVTGTLNAKGDDLGEKGGLVEVLGEKVGLFGSSTIDVSGYSGGGSALIGGDYQGLGNLRTAAATYIDPFTVINADAILDGNGGKIIVWSNNSTSAHGILSAKGGILSGNGGLIETSSKNALNVDGLVADASAPNGISGLWLIDPINTTISNGATANGSFNGANPDVFTPSATGAIVQASQINTRLNAGTNVKITTVGSGTGAAGTITLDAAATIGKTAGAHTVDLILEAAGGITLSGVISATSGIMNVILSAAGNIIFNNAVNTHGGNLTVTTTGTNDATFSNAAADINTAGGFVSFNLGDDFNMNNGGASITTAGGQVDVTANGAVITQAINSGSGNINLTASTGNMSIGTSLTTTSGNITANAADNITLSSAVQVTTAGGNFTANANTDADALGTFQQGAGGSTINTGNGSISISAKNIGLDGALITTGNGNIDLTATNGDIDLTQTLTTQFGDMNLNSDNGFRLNGASADLATSGGDININANTDGDADGDFDQNSINSSINTAGGNVSITANDFKLSGTTNVGLGDVSLLGAKAGSTYLLGTGSVAGFTGSITGAELQNITANNLTIGGSNVASINVRGITAANSNNVGKVHVNATSAGGNVTFDSAASTFNSLGAIAGNNVTFSQDVAVDLGTMTITADSDASGAGALTVDAGRTISTNGANFFADSADAFVNGSINTGTGAINGGNITINGSNQITIGATGSLNSTIGAGGIFSAIGAVTVNGAITVGQGDIILNGGGASPDLIITVPIISATSIFLSAVRDIIVQALLQTTNPADGNITLRADSDDDGVGGVWVKNTGALDAAQNVNIIGSDLFAIAGTQESIQIDADGANDQVLAAGDITLQTAGFAPAGSDMNLNGIVKSTGVGKTITVNSVGNINTSNNGVAELISDNQSLNAVEGIDAEINAKNISYNNSTSGNVSLEDMAGGLTVTGAVNGGAGSTTIVTHSPLTIAADMIQSGTINLTAGETAGAGDDLTVNAGKTVKSTAGDVNLKAGDNVNLNSGSTVQSDAGNIDLTAGNADADGNGDLNLAGAVNAFNNLILNAAQGGITQTLGSIAAANLQFGAQNNVALANATNNFGTVTGSSDVGSINLGNSAAAASIGNLTTTGNDITYNHSGAGSVEIAGTLNSGNGLDGGNITVNNLGGLLTVKNTAVLTSQTGVGGILSASNVTIEAGSLINVGLGNITLNGGGLDLIINVPIVSAVSIFLTALRDIIVQAGITTTNAADGHITLRADSDNDGVGGVWLQSTGFINSADDVNIMGSDLFAIPVTKESIQIDDNGGTQILAPNDITLQTTGFAPAGSNMNLNGLVNSTGVGKTVTVKSVGNINTSNNGVAELVGDNVDLQAVTGIDAEINGKNLSYSNTTSGDVSVEDMAGGLTVTGATNSGAGTTTITTHSPLTVATDIIQAGTVNLNAGEVAGAGDDFTLNAGKTVRSTAGDVNINAGDNVDLKLGSTVESTTGAVNVNAGFGDLDALGSISVAFISAATNAVLNAVGAIRGVTDDNTADVSGANVNLTAGAGGISGAGGIGALDVNVTTALAADTTNDNGNITIDSVANLPLGLVNAGTGTVTLVSEGNMRDANDGGTPDAPAVTNIIGGTINLTAKVGGIGIVGNAVDFLASTQFNADTTADNSNINVRSTGNAPIGLIDAGTGDVRLTSEGNITDANDGPTNLTWDNPGILNIHGGRIDLETVNGHDIGEFVNYLEIGPSTAWGANSHGGDIYIACIGPCPIDQVNLGTGTLYYTGNMVDFNDLLKGEDFGAIWNITAGGVHIDADNDPNGLIGSSTNWIETRLKDYNGVVDTPGRLVATSGTGGIHMSDDRDPLDLSIDTGLQIGGITPATITNVTSTGDIELYSFSPITVNASVNAIAGGNITLYALGTLPTDTMTVNANVQSSGGNGNIRMVSGGSFTMAPGTVISTQGNGVTSGTGQIIIGAGYDATGKAANEPAVAGITIDSPSSTLFDVVGDSNANLTMDETSRIWTENGDILVDAQNNFIVGRVDADGNSGSGITDGTRGNITTFSRNGSTLDAEPFNEGNLDFVANVLTMFSRGTIGLITNPIEFTAPFLNTFSVGDTYMTAFGNSLVNMLSTSGDVSLTSDSNIVLGHVFASAGSVDLNAGGSILSQGGSDDRVVAKDSIQLAAAGVVGTAADPINTILNSGAGTLFLSAGSNIGGISANVRGNFSSGQIQFLNEPTGLALFNGIAVGGGLLSGFNTALSNIFVSPLPLMLARFGQFDGRYTADVPGGFNLQQFGTPLPSSIDTAQLDTVQLPETVPPTVVPIPVPAQVPAARTQEKKQEKKAVVPPQPKKAVTQEQEQNPPAIVPIPTEAKPSFEKTAEDKGNTTTISGKKNG